MNYAIYETGKADFTSDASYPLRSSGKTGTYPVSNRVIIWGTFGGGSVSIEVKMPDDTWQSFPELTFTETTAQDVKFYEGAQIRAVIAGATSVNVLVAN